MKNILALASLILLLFAISSSCNTKKSADQSEEGSQRQAILASDSELTLLMREMFDETMKAKEQLLKGEAASFDFSHEEILTAHASDANKTASDEYKAFSEVHLQNLKNLQEADSSKMLTLYNGMIDNCMNCHKVVCPGPLNRIKTLKVSNADLLM